MITGIHADVDTAALGRPLQALIFIRIHSGSREELEKEADRLAELTPVLHVLFLGGHCDFVVWAALADPAELRKFVLEDLSRDRAIANTETCVIMEHRRGQAFDLTN
ncbi:Lrp/AsnC ligand binding domain-containing protein [Luteococcus sp. H138]|uniref:Lrp/AsnC family transcriptional regulator n=1 Tax=unclassified Luteococcus TaxID=2639923 RepID=UPI00313B6723